MKFHTGCSGFYNKHWKGIFYPEKMPAAGWLSFYASRLHTLELNNTFYRFPQLSTMQSWYAKVPEDFSFSVKVPKTITHLKKLNDCAELLDDFYSVCREGLQDKLACILFQFPPSMKYSDEMLEKVCASLKPGFRNVVEFRHESWWNEQVYKTLRENKISFCSISHPSLPDTIIATTETAYIRLHGTPRMFYSDYSEETLDKLLQSIRQQPEIRESFIYFNNTAAEAGILNALSVEEKTKASGV
ncbi:MAG: DUF72 domain-containing protein [Bacteroidota bacterium]